jgi:tRNA pseudouridine38-40 synthase
VSTRTVRLSLAYDGTDFRGWAAQRDPTVRTVEGELSRALERVVRERVRLSVAGRTDAGVHARGQVASFTTGSPVAPERIQAAVNGMLGPEIVIGHAAYAADGFDARFSATAREYRYEIETAEVPDPFTARYVWHRPRALSVPAIREGGRPLLGSHDFTSFCRHPGGDRSTIRDVKHLAVARRDDRVVVTIRANAFLHQMVRSIVGTLVAVGEGRLEPSSVGEILAARDRSRAAQPAPPRGLTLVRVVYGRAVNSP